VRRELGQTKDIIGISSILFTEVNEADAKVFLKVWTETIALTSSPEFVHYVFCFRPDCPDAYKKQVLATISTMHQSPGGQQMQAMFKADRMEEGSLNRLGTTRDLLTTHKRLYGEMNKVNTIRPSSVPGMAQGRTSQ